VLILSFVVTFAFAILIWVGRGENPIDSSLLKRVWILLDYSFMLHFALVLTDILLMFVFLYWITKEKSYRIVPVYDNNPISNNPRWMNKMMSCPYVHNTHKVLIMNSLEMRQALVYMLSLVIFLTCWCICTPLLQLLPFCFPVKIKTVSTCILRNSETFLHQYHRVNYLHCASQTWSPLCCCLHMYAMTFWDINFSVRHFVKLWLYEVR